MGLELRVQRLEAQMGNPNEITIAFFDCPSGAAHRLCYSDGREVGVSREQAREAIRAQEQPCKVYLGVDLDAVLGREACP